MSGFIGRKSNAMPPNYYRSHISVNDLRRVMDGAGPLSVTQVAGLLADKVPPEAKQRYMRMQQKGTGTKLSLEGQLFSGMRRIVQLLLPQNVAKGKVRKHGSGREAKYEWIATEDSQARQDSA